MKDYSKILENHFDDLADVLEARDSIRIQLKDRTECSDSTSHVILHHVTAYAKRYGIDVKKMNAFANENYGNFVQSDLSIATEGFLSDIITKIIDGIKWIFTKIINGIKKLFGLDSDDSSSDKTESSQRKRNDKKEAEIEKKLEKAKKKPTESEAEKKAKEVTEDDQKQEEVKKDLMNGKHFIRPDKITPKMEAVVAEVSTNGFNPNEELGEQLSKSSFEEDVKKIYANPNAYLQDVLKKYTESIGKISQYKSNGFRNDTKYLMQRFVDGISEIDKIVKNNDRAKVKEFLDNNQGMVEYEFRGVKKTASSFFFKDEKDAHDFHQLLAAHGIGHTPMVYNDRPDILVGKNSKPPADNEVYYVVPEYGTLGAKICGYSAIKNDPNSYAYPSMVCYSVNKFAVQSEINRRREKSIEKSLSGGNTTMHPVEINIDELFKIRDTVSAERRTHSNAISNEGDYIMRDLDHSFRTIMSILNGISRNYDDEGEHVSSELGYQNLLRNISHTFFNVLGALRNNIENGWAQAYDKLIEDISSTMYDLIDEMIKSSTAAK